MNLVIATLFVICLVSMAIGMSYFMWKSYSADGWAMGKPHWFIRACMGACFASMITIVILIGAST